MQAYCLMCKPLDYGLLVSLNILIRVSPNSMKATSQELLSSTVFLGHHAGSNIYLTYCLTLAKMNLLENLSDMAYNKNLPTVVMGSQ